MRISDWSSDVCSSDLVELVVQASGRLDSAVGCADLDRVPLGDTTRVGRFERQGKLRSGRTAAQGGDLSVLAMAEMPELALCKDQRDFGVPSPFGAGIGHRSLSEPLHCSEEHTSDLQSLLRLSFAVFCFLFFFSLSFFF